MEYLEMKRNIKTQVSVDKIEMALLRYITTR